MTEPVPFEEDDCPAVIGNWLCFLGSEHDLEVWVPLADIRLMEVGHQTIDIHVIYLMDEDGAPVEARAGQTYTFHRIKTSNPGQIARQIALVTAGVHPPPNVC